MKSALVTQYFKHDSAWMAKVELRLSAKDYAEMEPELWLRHLLVLVRYRSSGAGYAKHLFAGKVVTREGFRFDGHEGVHRFHLSVQVDRLFPGSEPSVPFYICFRCYKIFSPITLLDPNDENQ